MYSGDEEYGDEITSPVEADLLGSAPDEDCQTCHGEQEIMRRGKLVLCPDCNGDAR